MSAHKRTITLATRARRDLVEILELSLEIWGPDHMHEYEATIDKAIEQVAMFPESGVRSEHLIPGGRRKRAGHHVIYYSFSSRHVIIHRVLHEKRLVTRGILAGSDPD